MLRASGLAEALGFTGVWLSEHRLWYDGYDSTPLQTAMRILARTETLRVGTAVLLLPQHAPHTVLNRALQTVELAGNRLDLGVGLGYRNIEFDALGLRRRDRGPRMDVGLKLLSEGWSDNDQARTLYVGAASEPALRRAGRHKAGVVLPGGWSPDTVSQALDVYREAADGVQPPDTALVRHLWLRDGGPQTRQVIDAVVRLFRDQYGGMAELEGSSARHPGVDNPQSELTVGSAQQIIDLVGRYEEAGVTHLIARLHNPYLPGEAVEEGIAALADTLSLGRAA